MIIIFVLPALIVSAIALRVLLKRKKKRETSLFWQAIALAPLLFLIYEIGMAALWSFQNIESGNGSARAAHGVIFIVVATLAAIYGLVIAYWVLRSNRLNKYILIFQILLIVLPAIVYDIYDAWLMNSYIR